MKYLILLLLLGCTSTYDCPECKCPTITPSTPDDEYHINLTTYDLEIHFIDVGQGDAILIKGGEEEMLIDCGNNADGPMLIEYLEELNVTELEYLVMTHPDSDHIGGCDNILDKFETRTVIHNGEEKDTLTYREVIWELDDEQEIIAKEGMSWPVSWSTVTVIHASQTGDTNERSIVLHLNEGTFDVLFTGDCDDDCEDKMVNKAPQVEILKVAHHGSPLGTSTKFVQTVSPNHAVISVGDGNSYGHPSEFVLDELNQNSVIVFRTDIDGTVIVRTNGEDYNIN